MRAIRQKSNIDDVKNLHCFFGKNLELAASNVALEHSLEDLGRVGAKRSGIGSSASEGPDVSTVGRVGLPEVGHRELDVLH